LQDELNDRNPAAVVRLFVNLSAMIGECRRQNAQTMDDSVQDKAIAVCGTR
jgi:hypothetical protein